MRPDRFGQSRAREFVESLARERQHPFSARDTLTPGITLQVFLRGFSMPNVQLGGDGYPNFPDQPIGTGWVKDFSGYKLYRHCHFEDNFSWLSIGRTDYVRRNLDLTMKNLITPVTGVSTDPAAIEVTRNLWDYGVVGASSTSFWQTTFGIGQTDEVNETYIQGSTIAGLPGGIVGRSTRTLSHEIDLKPWLEFVYDQVNRLSDFPETTGANQLFRLQSKPGIDSPDAPPPDTGTANAYFDLIEVGPSGLSTGRAIVDVYRQGSSFGYGNGLLGTGVEAVEKFPVPFCGIIISMTKALAPARRLLPDKVKKWTVRTPPYIGPPGGGNWGPVVEDACELIDRTEVVMPPRPSELNLPGTLHAAYKTSWTVARRGYRLQVFHFPGSQVPADVPIVPTCAPAYL